MVEEKIEILSVSLFQRYHHEVKNLRVLACQLGIEFGWHYLLDLIWVIGHLNQIGNARIMDAGAGVGIIQWYLAEKGAEVISVDRYSRADLPLHFRIFFSVDGLRETDLNPLFKSIILSSDQKLTRLRMLLRSLLCILRAGFPKTAAGRVLIYNQDLQDLADINNDSIDIIVSISALEHNQRENMDCVVSELMRTLKPGGMLLATVNSSKDKDWYHEPSQGWCLTEGSIREIFDLSTDITSNFHQYDELFSALYHCSELRENLAKFYSRSGNNGMPWGVWNPQYLPVGVLKVKGVT
jgi:2-polyprenyl-3-methyl-5-hydroxy-6-metoxy-1,4-benzoquinol methylase